MASNDLSVRHQDWLSPGAGFRWSGPGSAGWSWGWLPAVPE